LAAKHNPHAPRREHGPGAAVHRVHKISLISKSEIRYEGILHDINNNDSSLTVQNVKSYGTEGRKKVGPQIPPSAEIYDYIVFKGTDIQDIQIEQVRSTDVPGVI